MGQRKKRTRVSQILQFAAVLTHLHTLKAYQGELNTSYRVICHEFWGDIAKISREYLLKYLLRRYKNYVFRGDIVNILTGKYSLRVDIQSEHFDNVYIYTDIFIEL